MKEVKILLVDDNPIDAKLTNIYLSQSKALKSHFFHALSLSIGVKKMIEEEDFDIVLLDLSLSDSSDLDTLSQAMSRFPYAPPIIVLTGVEDHDVIIGAKEMGASDFLLKDDMNTKTITEVILNALEK